MSTHRRIGTVVTLAVLTVAPARGQQSPAKGQEAPSSALAGPMAGQYVDECGGIGLDAAIARALEREPSLRSARADIDVAQGLQRQASLRANPTFTFERREEPAGTDNLTSVGVAWPLDLFRRSGRVRSAEREVDVRRLAANDRQRLLAADVRTFYDAAAAAVREVTVADELVTAADRQWNVVRARVEAGAAPPIERDLLEVELRRLEAERLRAGGRADVAMVQLKRILGMSPEDALSLRETLETLVARSAAAPTPEAPALTTARADVRAAEARVTLADARIDQERRNGRLDVSVFGTYMRMDAGFPQQGVGPSGELERVRGRFNYIAGGAMVVVPVFGRNQGQIAAAQAERSVAEARRDAVTLDARAEVAAAQARDARARQAVRLYESGVRRLARQNLDVVRQTFDLGRTTVFEVLTEQRRVLEVEQAYTSALREAWEAHADLTRALGDMP